MPTVVIINPNSSSSVTRGLQKSLLKDLPPDLDLFLQFVNPPPSSNSPESINDPITSVLSASASWVFLRGSNLLDDDNVIGFLVCCFSDHPLTEMLRFYYEAQPKPRRKTVLNILESSVNHCISLRKTFGILTTGAYWEKPLTDAVNSVLGNQSDGIFVGVVCSGLGVVELGSSGDVETVLKRCAVQLVEKGANAIILGCSGMAGMENLINTSVVESGLGPVVVIDGARAGVQLFIEMVTKNRHE